MTFGALRVDCDCTPSGVDAALVLATLCVGRNMAAKPVACPRQLPSGFEIPSITRETSFPQIGRALRAGDVFAVDVQAIRIVRLEGERAGKRWKK
jgi:hypothetical protein